MYTTLHSISYYTLLIITYNVIGDDLIVHMMLFADSFLNNYPCTGITNTLMIFSNKETLTACLSVRK